MRELVTVPNKVLTAHGRQLDVSNREDVELIRELRNQLDKVMRQNKALGITACQIGEPVDLFIINQHKLQGAKKFNYFINAHVEGIGEKVDSEECCLSIPGKVFRVKRHPRVRVTVMMLNGTERTRTFSGLTAACIQQEHDHTKGILLSHIGELVREV